MALTLLSGYGELISALPTRTTPESTDLIQVQPLNSQQAYSLPLGLAQGISYGLYAGGVTVPGRFLAPTASSAQSVYLPALSSVVFGAGLVIRDQDDNAGTNNITIHASGSDLIYDHGTVASSFVMNISNTIAEIVCQSTIWRVIVYGS